MGSYETHKKKTESANANMTANSLKAKGRERRYNNILKINSLWLWLGVLVLIAILLYWLFSIGMFESLAG